MKTKTKTQAERILNHLEKGRKITQVEAFNKYGCWRLAARISELRHDGHDIRMKLIKRNGKQYAQYWL